MERFSFRKMLALYLKDKSLKIFKFLIYILIFSLVLFLYNNDLEPILYAVILIFTVELILTVIDFCKFYKSYSLIMNVKNNLDVGIDDLPEGKTLIEKEYIDIIRNIYSDKNKLISSYDNQYSEMLDYYTLWVHQIKTPISSLSMIIQSMEKSDFRFIMEEQLFKIQQYVEMVLQYVRLGSSSSDLKLQKYPLKKIINSAVKKYSINFIHKKIMLNIENIDIQVLTDAKWISFVIEQILSNALKYTKTGSISIYMENNILTIEDTGIGISEQDIPRVFEKGFTGYNGRMDKKSSGIGLYLCKKIVDNLNHKIYMESKIGKGTKVMIDFSVEDIAIE